ncbi:hypothetical protein BO70DRAFT_423065 [Aspergillus heteromorphus CBS 117.55]|uniref:Uncharacterized protein n=1 Tax=Aspergillus heteromorphus CBS 117.55 TaxID=1448321 RepID=A0A317WI29_9EURO|nr:uncharacterized protein BO70DRAFT_423065 [Aspergillus heteromorphus CBS 117.55]PWY85949.1 hypothetical protein BO70DRAFT_423065 [Aspergillus heteromorphus CBS 117.55]
MPPFVLHAFFVANTGSRHMDIGVGTGLFPAVYRDEMQHEGKQWPQQLTLVDMNTACLDKAAARMNCPEKTTVLQADIFEPIPVPAETKFDSITLMYLLHCLPPPSERKSTVFAHLKDNLTPERTLFGATVLGQEVHHNWIGRLWIMLYNWKGIFHNVDDTAQAFVKSLELELEEVDANVVGVVLLFRARNSRLP